jgi:hypothetical protein
MMDFLNPPFWGFERISSLGLSSHEGQVLVGFGFGNEDPSEYLEFDHNPTALILYKPIVRAFSRIGDKFNLTCHARAHDRPF